MAGMSAAVPTFIQVYNVLWEKKILPKKWTKISSGAISHKSIQTNLGNVNPPQYPADVIDCFYMYSKFQTKTYS